MRFLVAIGASLRFSDCQHVRWSTHVPAFSHFVEYATGLRQCAEEPRRGCSVLAAFLFGKLGHDVAPKVAGSSGRGLELAQNPLRRPDEPRLAFFFLRNESSFAPASYAQTLCRLRELLVRASIPASQARQYTLHSLKTTYLCWMSQLSIPLSACFLQGHHKSPGSAQLYSRDDVWPSLRAQMLFRRAIYAGFRPSRLVDRLHFRSHRWTSPVSHGMNISQL